MTLTLIECIIPVPICLLISVLQDRYCCFGQNYTAGQQTGNTWILSAVEQDDHHILAVLP